MGKISIKVVYHYYGADDSKARYVTIEDVLPAYSGAYIGRVPARWVSYDSASKWIDKQDTSDYSLRYVEYARPDYTIVRAPRMRKGEVGADIQFD
jgi:hypothetical protein